LPLLYLFPNQKPTSLLTPQRKPQKMFLASLSNFRPSLN
jgi:hypothetical protein